MSSNLNRAFALFSKCGNKNEAQCKVKDAVESWRRDYSHVQISMANLQMQMKIKHAGGNAALRL